MKRVTLVLLVALAAIVLGCGADENGGEATGPVGLRGAINKGPFVLHSAKHKQIYEDFKKGKITEAQARERIGEIFRQEKTSTSKETTYVEKYRKIYGEHWDKHH